MALSGKTLVFTGTLTMKRAEATKLACAAGAKVTGSVSKSTSIIVAGTDATHTSKVLTAKAFGTLVWSEADFKKAIEGGSAKAGAKAKATRGRPPPKAAAAPRAKVISEKEQHAFADAAKGRNFAKVIELVKENPLYVNVQPAGRWSALHQASEAGHEEAVEFLLAHGADLAVKTSDGKTPKDVAKGKVKDLLVAAWKRKADSSDAGSAKRAKVAGPAPTLHLFEPMSARNLAEEQGGWFKEDDESLCRDGFEHQAMKSAPDAAKKIAGNLKRTLGDATLPAGESDCTGLVVVISNPGSCSKEACLQALAIEQDVWDEATCESRDLSCSQFVNDLSEDEEEDEDEDENSDGSRIKEATVIMKATLKDHFKFNFTDNIVTAPIIWGGFAPDKSIVGVLGMRVWT